MSISRDRVKPRAKPLRSGFTMIEVILVVVIIIIVSSVSIPYFSGSMRGHKLRTSGRMIMKMAGYSRAMAIMREETMTMVLNPETMEIYLGGREAAPTNTTDGVIDQDVFKRLGFTDGDEDGLGNVGVEREVRRFLPDDLSVKNFDKNWTEEDDAFEDLYLIRFYPNGQCDWFELELVDKRDVGIRLENDPISGKIRSEFLQ